jgi:tetratricopeptide (TPR) repeat protein
LERFAKPHAFNRFMREDYQPLLVKLNKYVPAPKFKMLTPQQQLQRLADSKRQLLIALHEATFSENFSEVILSEYEHLPDYDTKRLFLLAGLGTMARVGVGLEFAAAAYEKNAKRPLKSALEALAGIVELTDARRMVARHESYVRQIFERAIDFETFTSVLGDLLGVYANFEVPVIRKVNRTDGYLFKHVLNADFIYQMSSTYGDPVEGRRIYERFEVEFQLDGHFWLQYGTFLIKCNKYEDALKALTRSIQAYPENIYARHALAHLKLRMASHRASYDTVTQQLVDEAVTELELEHARTNPTVDDYPLVTLSMAHIQVLAAHNQRDRALVLAKQYHARLQDLGKRIANTSITRAEEAMLRYVTLGEVPGRLFGPANPTKRKANRQ